MKIHSINNFNTGRYNNTLKPTNHGSSTAFSKPDFQLSGIPRAYISFCGNSEEQQITLPPATNLTDEQRRRAISEYMEYKELAKDFENEKADKPLYKEWIEARISKISNERGHYGYFSNEFKPYRVKKLERRQIEQEEYNKYCQAKDKYNLVKNNLSYFENLLNTEDIEIYEKAKHLLSKEHSMEKVLAGYSSQKTELRKLIIDPIQRENLINSEEKLPPAVILYGPTGCGKTKMAQTLAQEANCKIVSLPPQISARKFTGALKCLLDEARDYYTEQKKVIDAKYDSDVYKWGSTEAKARYSADIKSPRTIILVNEIDKYFNPYKIGETENAINAEYIADMNKTFLKGVLDHCSERPDDSDSSGAAGVTFIFTTNYPSRVDSEITLRNGKCYRMPFYMPDDSERKDILKFYIENYANPAIEKAISEGKDLKCINSDKIPYDSYVSISDADAKKGAIAGAGIEKAVTQATSNYLNNKNQYLNLQLAQMLSGAQYRVPPHKLDEYLKELDAMGLRYKEIDEKEEYELLKDLDKFEMITEEQKVRYNYLKEIYEIEK